MTPKASEEESLPVPGQPRRAAGEGVGALDQAAETASAGVRDRIVRDVIRGLYEGRYEPGQRLQEGQLTAAYTVSRGPVREAIYALAAMNIVELTPQSGAQVRVVSIQEAIDTLIVAQSLIGLSARLAAERHDDLAASQRLVAALETINAFSTDEVSAPAALSREAFYGAITNMAANVELSRLLPTVRVHLIRVQFRSVLRADDGRRRSDYRRIASAIRAGEPNKAEKAARLHLARSITLLRAHQGK
jgi:DNA-binding GntR family transcriptional regulator